MNRTPYQLPGFFKHPPLPTPHGPTHLALAGGMLGWQIALIAIAAALFAAAMAVTVDRLGSGRPISRTA